MAEGVFQRAFPSQRDSERSNKEMKIIGENQYLKLDAYLRTRSAKDEKDSGSKALAKSDAGGDTVVLSSKAQELYAARRILEMEDIPEVRADKVARLRREIEDGTYRVEGRDIAQKMLDEAMENDRLLRNP